MGKTPALAPLLADNQHLYFVAGDSRLKPIESVMMTANVIKIKRNPLTGLSQTVSIPSGSTKAISEIWNHFAKLGNDQVRCCNCGIEMAQGANSTTKSMWCHLMYKHKNIYSSTRHYYIKQLQKNSIKHANKAKAPTSADIFTESTGQQSTSELGNEFDEEDFEEDNLDSFLSHEDPLNNFSSDNYSSHKDTVEGDSNSVSPTDQTVFHSPVKTVFKIERDMTESPKPVELQDVSGNSCNKEAKDIFNLKLLQVVSTHPAIYDHQHKGYKSNDIRIKEWYDIAQAVDQPVEFARTRWKTLRDRFKKECRKQQQRNARSQWLHFSDMMFLAPFVRDRGGNDDSILHDDPINWDYDDFGCQSHEDLKTKRDALAGGNSTNYILDFAMNVVANGKSPVSATSPESNFEESSRQKLQTSHKKNTVGNGKNGDGTATVTTTLEKPFKFDNSYERDQNRGISDLASQEGFYSRKRMFNQTAGREVRAGGLEDMHETNAFWDEGRNHYSNNNANNSYNQPNNNPHMYESSSSHFNNHKSSGTNSQPNNTTSNRNPGKVDEEEDELFCRIMLKKLKKMSEHQKEKCKAKVLDLLVQFQYGVMS